MTPREAEMLIEHVLSKRLRASSDRYNLCIVNGVLVCLGSHSCVKPEAHIATMTELQIVNGFSSNQWDSMSEKIVQYCKKESKCLNDPKP